MTTISTRLQVVKNRITAAAGSSNRSSDDIQLLAVSKTWPAEAIREAYQQGQRLFAENYVQEALAKMRQLSDLPIEWHFIGPIQSNKTQQIARQFSWVHGIDRPNIALRLNDARPQNLPPLQACLQVNISGEASKHGVSVDDAPALAKYIATLQNIRLRGLMAIPKLTSDYQLQRQQYKMLRDLMLQLNAQGFELDTLSAGMSQDLEAAIAEGATLVRVGSSIFGNRY